MGFFDKFGSALIQGIGGIGSSIIGGIVNRKNTKETNAQNLKIAQMNNEWSERMMDKQNLMNIAQWQRESQFAEKQAKDANAFTEAMWQKQADYNSASAQADRLRQAGLNPALAMSGQNAGSVTGASGAQGATPSGNSVGLPSPSQATMQTDNFGQFIARSVESAAMLARNSAEINNLNTQSDVAKAEAAAEIARKAEETRSLRFKNKLNDITESLQFSMMNEQYLSAVQSRLTQEQQLKLYKQTEIMNDITIANLPEQMKADISLKLANAEAVTMTDLAKDLKFFERKYNTRISNEDLRMLYEAWKKTHIFAPYKGLSTTGAAATIGGIIGDKIKSLWK